MRSKSLRIVIYVASAICFVLAPFLFFVSPLKTNTSDFNNNIYMKSQEILPAEIVTFSLSDVSGFIEIKLNDLNMKVMLTVEQRGNQIYNTIIGSENINNENIWKIKLQGSFVPNEMVILKLKEVSPNGGNSGFKGELLRRTLESPEFIISNSNLFPSSFSFDWIYKPNSWQNKLNFIDIKLFSQNGEVVEKFIISGEEIINNSGRITRHRVKKYKSIIITANYSSMNDLIILDISGPISPSPFPRILNLESNNYSPTSTIISFDIFDPDLIIEVDFGFFLKITDLNSNSVEWVKVTDNLGEGDEDIKARWVDKYIPPYNQNTSVGSGSIQLSNLKSFNTYKTELVIGLNFDKYLELGKNKFNYISESIIFETDSQEYYEDRKIISDLNEFYSKEINKGNWSTFFNFNLELKSPIFEIDTNDIKLNVFSNSNLLVDTNLNFIYSPQNNNSYELFADIKTSFDLSSLENLWYLITGKFSDGVDFSLYSPIINEEKLSDYIFSRNSQIISYEEEIILYDNFSYRNDVVDNLDNFTHLIHEQFSGTTLSGDVNNLSISTLNSDNLTEYELQTNYLKSEFNFLNNQEDFKFISILNFDFKIRGVDGIFNQSDSDIHFTEDIIFSENNNFNNKKLVITLSSILPIVVLSFIVVTIKIRGNYN